MSLIFTLAIFVTNHFQKLYGIMDSAMAMPGKGFHCLQSVSDLRVVYTVLEYYCCGSKGSALPSPLYISIWGAARNCWVVVGTLW